MVNVIQNLKIKMHDHNSLINTYLHYQCDDFFLSYIIRRGAAAVWMRFLCLLRLNNLVVEY